MRSSLIGVPVGFLSSSAPNARGPDPILSVSDAWFGKGLVITARRD
jgi:hypothetical protein